MARMQSRKAALLCLFLAVALNSISLSVDAAAIPRDAPLKVQPMQGDIVTAPTPLPIVSTYTLYFGSGGSTTPAPIASQTVTSSTSSASTSSSAPPRSTSSTGKCSKKKHTSAGVSPSSTSLASTSVGANKASATTTSPAQQNSIFPTVAPATATSSGG